MNDQNDNSKLPARLQNSGELTRASYDALSDEDKKVFAMKRLEAELRLNESAVESDRKYQDSTKDLDNFVVTISDLERSTQSDIKGRIDADSASGRITIEVKRQNEGNKMVIVIVIAVAVLALAILIIPR